MSPNHHRVRLRCLAIALCGVAASDLRGAPLIPRIAGNVTSPSLQPVENATVRLFLDDGDGVFEPFDDDSLAQLTTTDPQGGYLFDGLDPGSGYFVDNVSESSPLILPGSANQLVDGFADTMVLSANPVSPVDQGTSTGNVNVLGEERDMAVTFESGVGSINLSSNAYGVDSTMDFSSSPTVTGQGTVTWDGIDNNADATPALGLNGLDLTDGGAYEGFVLRLGFDQASAGDEMLLRIFQGDGATFSEAPVSMVVNGGLGTAFVTVPFTDFVGSVSPENVDAIQMIITMQSGSFDTQVSEVGLFGDKHFNFTNSPSVPEPAAFWLALIFIVGYFQRTRA